MGIRVPLTASGHVDMAALNRAMAEDAGEPAPMPPTPEEIAAWHRERASIEVAIGMDHLRRAAEHMRAQQS